MMHPALVFWMLYWLHLQKNHSAVTLNHCSFLTIKDFAVQAEMVAVESSLDVGNILWMFYDCLCLGPSILCLDYRPGICIHPEDSSDCFCYIYKYIHV